MYYYLILFVLWPQANTYNKGYVHFVNELVDYAFKVSSFIVFHSYDKWYIVFKRTFSTILSHFVPHSYRNIFIVRKLLFIFWTIQFFLWIEMTYINLIRFEKNITSPWCSGYCYGTISSNKIAIWVLRRCKLSLSVSVYYGVSSWRWV